MTSNHSQSETQSPSLPIVWANLTTNNLTQLKRLNSIIFPINYKTQFYDHALHAPPGFVKLAYHNQLLVAAVCCRKEKYQQQKVTQDGNQVTPLPPDLNDPQSKSSLYIMTLGVLAPYRERGIGKQLITHVLDLANTSPECTDVVDVYLHMQLGNENALSFYKSYGFQVTETLKHYYKRLDPHECLIVRKSINRH